MIKNLGEETNDGRSWPPVEGESMPSGTEERNAEEGKGQRKESEEVGNKRKRRR